jgi:hypothetical protein
MIVGRPESGWKAAYQVPLQQTSMVARRALHATLKALRHKGWTNFGEETVGIDLAARSNGTPLM